MLIIHLEWNETNDVLKLSKWLRIMKWSLRYQIDSFQSQFHIQIELFIYFIFSFIFLYFFFKNCKQMECLFFTKKNKRKREKISNSKRKFLEQLRIFYQKIRIFFMDLLNIAFCGIVSFIVSINYKKLTTSWLSTNLKFGTCTC